MINNNIKFQQLRHFVSIAEAGKFSKAANLLGIAQPALSQSINKLELILNATLFKRTQQGVILTEAGKLLVPKAKNILNNIVGIEQDIKSLFDEPSGTVKIFLSPKLANFICIKLYKVMKKKYPKIKIEFEEGFGLRGSKLIETGEIDLGILPDWNFNKNINSELIISDTLYFYGKRDKLNDTNQPIRFSELINYPLILTGAQVILKQKLNEISNKLNKKLQIILDSNSQAYTESFIKEGLGFSIGPAEASYFERKNNQFFARKIIEPEIQRSVVICWPKSILTNKATQVTADNILLILKSMLNEKVLVGSYLLNKDQLKISSLKS